MNLFSNSISIITNEFQGKLDEKNKASIKISIFSAHRATWQCSPIKQQPLSMTFIHFKHKILIFQKTE